MNLKENPVWMQHPELDGDSFFLPGNAIGFLLIHGFTATTTEVRPLAVFLNQQGFTVSAPLLPGHGTHPDDLNRTRWKDWVDLLENSYQQLQATCRVIFVGGESMGGLLSLYIAWRHPEIAGVLLYAPAVKIRELGRARFLSIFRDIHWKKGGDESMPWKGYRVVPLKAIRQLYKLQRLVINKLQNIHQPVIVCQGSIDQSLDLRGPEKLIKRLGTHDKALHWFSASRHCILLDREFPQVSQISLSFINRILAQNHSIEVKS